MKRPTIGDVIEINTGHGLAYCHYSHKHPTWTYLIRVFSKLYQHAPEDLAFAVEGRPTFNTFFPLGSYVNRGVVRVAGSIPLSDEAKIFPRFRNGNPNVVTGKVREWSIWDGEQTIYVGPVNDEIRRLSQHGLCDIEFLVGQIVGGYTPETDSRLE
jgi:hypothetical protein